jgi:glutathione reductase (NADPH)
VLVSTVELYARARAGGALGLTGTGGIGLDWPAVIARKDSIVAAWSRGKKEALEKKGIAVLLGGARFTGPNEIAVGERRLGAGRVVIATGSTPARPPVEGAERALTSDELLSARDLPQRLVVIGGGAIGMELGFCFARAGSQVTVLHRDDRILAGADAEVRDALLEIGRAAGMRFETNASVRRISADAVEAERGVERLRLPADVVLAATGRPPNLGPLDLERAGVELDRGFVRVNEYLQSTSAPHVYAAGDVASRRQHTPVAWYEGALAGHNAVRGNEKKADLSLLPTAFFTIPALAQVGLTEAEARAQGLDVAVHRSPLRNNPAAGVRGETEGLVKIVYERPTDRVLGVHVLGAHAEDLVQIAAAAMRGGLTRTQVGAMHYVFPTLGAAVFDAMAGW